MSGQLELIVDAKALLGEGPCWDAEAKKLYWVDIERMSVHIYDSAASRNRSLNLSQYVSAIVPAKAGGAIVTMHHGFYLLDLETTELTFIADPEAELPQQRFNDGKCDAAGRFWAGTMPLEGSNPTGKLYCLDTDFTLSTVLENIYCSNGIAWSLDNKIMYYIDSLTRQVVAFDYDLTQGTISNKRVAVEIPENGGLPDGMTLDAEGMIWVAQWDGWQVSRWNPLTGQMLEKIAVPAARVASCTFGGDNLDELYITTARTGLSEEELSRQPYAGGLFRCKTKVNGLPAHRFG